MTKYAAIGAIAVSMGLFFAACSSDDNGGDGDGDGTDTTGSNTGAAGPGSGGSGTGGNGTGGTGTGGGGDMCEEYFADPELDPACVSCLADECCDEAEACVADPGCAGCFDNDDGTPCDVSNPNIGPLVECFDTPACTQDQNGLICGQAICESGLVLSLTAAECAACLGTECCDQYTACAADMACLDCITGQAANPDACETNPLLDAANTCADTSCNMVCATEICDSGLQTGDPQCNNCLEASCCSPIKDCAANDDCLACLVGDKMPNDPACMNNALLEAVDSCWDTNCSMECGPTR